jgi:ribosomal protein L37AE/L43A
MGEICPACNKGELKELVAGIRQCSVCKKIIKTTVESPKEEKKEAEFIDGETFMAETALNAKYEIADKGITVEKEPNKTWLAVLMCHTPSFPNTKYLRISWWKKSINEHAGMFKIDDIDELDNTLIALERLEAEFDDNFDPIKNINPDPLPERQNYVNVSLFDEKTKLCPNCKSKMKISKNHRFYECEPCGEIIVLEEGHPIYNMPSTHLPLSFSSNFPVNFYLPSYGITVKLLMAEWKAIIIVYAKENPEKKWLRFYWWQRDLQNYMLSEFTFGVGKDLKWEPKKGALSPNIYEKRLVRPLIDALKKMRPIFKEAMPKQEKEKAVEIVDKDSMQAMFPSKKKEMLKAAAKAKKPKMTKGKE